MDRPLVSVILPTYDAAAHVDRAIASALSQTWHALEVVVADDASRDSTPALIESWSRRDPRVRLLRMAQNGGPATARNAAIAASRGAWLALLDADDAFQPGRIERLLEVAANHDADLVADNLHLVDGTSGQTLGTALPQEPGAPPAPITASDFIRRNLFGQKGFALGYLKPIIRRGVLDRHGIRYREEVRIGEDYPLYLDCLLAGARFVLVPEAMYDYRLEPGSISRRLPESEIAGLAELNARQLAANAEPEVRAALSARQTTIRRMQGHARFVDLAKRGRWVEVAAMLLGRPDIWPLVAKYGRESVLKRLGRLGFHGLRA
jgi:succinoglycan biosynthesis protein ExoO